MVFRKIFYPVLSILIIIFIFNNSLQTGTISSEASQFVLDFCNNILSFFNINFTIQGVFIRKLAHFIEFFLLGFFVMMSFNSFFKFTFHILGFPLFICLLIPVIDEYIQSFVVGRSSLVSDVLIDFAGAFTGIIFVVFYIFIKNKFFSRKNIFKYNGNKYNFKLKNNL